tara:strand:- start:18579 stop:19706 length:1128 start_codon:yes stop_codon:yes gene_type:complete
MKLKLLSSFFFFLTINISFSQESILVTESTIILDLEETKELFFSFAEGDEIIFNMQMVKGKHIKEIEIIEMPSNSLLTEFKSERINNKHIQIRNKGIYKFRFYSSSITRRVCKIKIHRIPTNETSKDFNTNWKWKILKDTTYTAYQEDSLVGYKTQKYKTTKKELVKIDTSFVEILSRSERVHSSTAIGKSQYNYININLPENKYIPNNIDPYESTENMAWSHWIGVGEQSKQDYESANENLMNDIDIIGNLTGYGAMAKLAITGISLFSNNLIGNNVNYKFITIQNGIQKVFNSGNVTSDSGRNMKFLHGGFTIELYNDNFKEGIDVNIKIVVVQINKKWKNIEFEEEKEEPQYVTLNKTRININETKIRVPIE